MQTEFRRKDWIAVVVITTLALGVYVVTLRPGHDWGGDFSVYLGHARNLVEGRPYSETPFRPTAESILDHPPAYPPVFPFLLAPVYATFGLNYTALKLVVAVCFALSLPFYYALARLRGGEMPESAIAALGFGLSALVLTLKESVISEGAYSLFAGAALYVATLAYCRGWHLTRPVSAGLAVAALFLLAYGSRVAGLALTVAFVFQEILNWRRGMLFKIVVAGTFLAGVSLVAVTVYDFRSYGQEFRLDWEGYWTNLVYYVRSPATLWGGAWRWFRYPVTLAALLLAGTELVRRTVFRPTIAEWYSWVTVGTVLLYTSGRSPRYMAGFFPLFLIYAMEGARWWAKKLVPSWERAVRGLVIATLAVGIAFNVGRAPRGPIPEGVAQPTFAALCEFLARHTTAADVLASSNPRVIAFYTERPSVRYPYARDDRRFWQGLRETRATHLVVFRHVEEDREQLLPFIARNRDRLRLLYENPDHLVYALP
ncbi:MAG: hypothetical protein RMK57_14670 [Bryobacterales bacterium]|nr:DUF2079 domain-containing protein [Bryobacteraceae bacterium]MDW8355764.1 hypothetical protein [Bryobacterales bacterium]